MLFNSQEFLFIFLPVTLIGFYWLGSRSSQWAIFWLILASLLFYGWWRPVNILIIGPSILINYLLAAYLLRLTREDRSPGLARAVLLLGVAFNVLFLGYFKYTDFVLGSVNDVFGANLILRHIILPLGISFITFQKIAFLIDVHDGRVKSFSFRQYCTFVLFFPQLISGPIVHYREMMPQFDVATCRFDRENFAVGLTLLLFGLFKKGVLADNVATFVTPIYEHSAAAGRTPLLLAWMAGVGFMLQLYFDFSGYTDMALGLARFFGIKLPPNFNSPLRASSIIDFWLRWHMTLTRFLTTYLYNPMVLALTRRRMAKGQPGWAPRTPTAGAFLALVMVPMITTMFISGLWHGAGYGFVIWGVLHGIFLVINHAWRAVGPRWWPDRAAYDRTMKPVGFVITFVTVCAAILFFRASTLKSAIDLIKGFFGLNGFAMPHGAAAIAATYGTDIAKGSMWIAFLLFIALLCPNTLDILAPYEPALGWKTQPNRPAFLNFKIPAWGPSLPWAVAVSIVAAVAIFSTGGPSEFLYWQF